MSASGIRILFAGDSDYANCSNRVARAINEYAGFKCARVLLKNRHRLGYYQDLYTDDGGLQAAISHLKSGSSSIVLTTGDGSYDLVKLISSRLDIPIGSLHVGTPYRENSRGFDVEDLKLGSVIRFISPDSIYLTKVNCLPYLHCIDRRRISPIRKIESPIVFHSPTSDSMKGTPFILKAIESTIKEVSPKPFKYRVIRGMSYEGCRAERSKGHIFIGQLNTRVGGFGYSSVEAAADGLVPIASMNNSPASVWSDVGLDEPPVLNATDESSLSRLLCDLIRDPDMLYECRVRAYEWATCGSVSMIKAGGYYVDQISRVI